MTTLLTALFYLWLVITILLGAMWFLRRQEELRGDPDKDLSDDEYLDAESELELEQPGSETLEPGLEADLESDPEPDLELMVEADVEADLEPTIDTELEAEPEPAEQMPVAEVAAEPEQEPELEPVAEAEVSTAEVEAEPVATTDTKTRRKSPKRRKPAGKPKSNSGSERSDATGKNGAADKNGQTAKNGDAGKNGQTAKNGDGADGDKAGINDRAEPAAAVAEAPAELLADIALPLDLVRSTERVIDPTSHIILLSTNDDAEAVGTAFADELSSLGFEIEPDGLDQARAVRGDEVLSLRISPNAGTRGSGKYRRYPSAGDSDVAIEVWTGGGKPPKLAKA